MENVKIRISNQATVRQYMEPAKLYQLENPIMVFVTKGELELTLQIGSYAVRENTLLLSDRKTIYQISKISDDFEAKIISYDEDYLAELGLKLNKLKIFKHFRVHLKEANALPANQMRALNSQIDALENILVHERDVPYQREVVDHLFSGFIYLLAGFLLKQEASEPHLMTRNDEITYTFVKDVFEFFREKRLLGFYADRQHLTVRHLSSVIKKVTGKTGNQIISEFVVSEAKILLLKGKKSISQIAADLYFSDAYVFSHFFKKHAGSSPTDFRKKSMA